MKKLSFAFLFLLLAACNNTEEAATVPQPATEAPAPVPETTPAQNVDNSTNAETTPPTPSANTKLTEDEALAITQEVIDHLRAATEDAGYDTTIEAIQEAWAPYVTQDYMDSVSEYLDCAFDYCGALYQVPNSANFGWKRQFHFLDNDTFSTDALVPNLGDSVGLFSLLQSMELKRDDGNWKLNHVDFQPEDINLSEDEVIPFLAQVYDVHINDFYSDTLENGEFQHGIYVFTHPEYNEEYFVDGYTGTMYGRAFYEEFMNAPVE